MVRWLAGTAGVALLFVWAGTAHGRGQNDARTVPLTIEGKAFRVGMSRQEAMTLLAECCMGSPWTPAQMSSLAPGVTPPGDDDGLFIFDKTKALVGAIFFSGGRVVGLRRDEKQSRGQAAGDVILAFYRSVLDGKPHVRAEVTVTAQPTEGVNFSGRTLSFAFPDGRVLDLRHSVGDDGTVSVELHEGSGRF